MSETDKGAVATPASDAKASPDRERRSRRAGLRAGSVAVRNRLAAVVWLVAVVCALFLAVGALLVALKANQQNSVVQFVLDGARSLEGPFRDLFTFEGANAATKNALVNWGIAALVFLVVGKVLDRVIRP